MILLFTEKLVEATTSTILLVLLQLLVLLGTTIDYYYPFVIFYLATFPF